jgi:hypothetical protein
MRDYLSYKNHVYSLLKTKHRWSGVLPDGCSFSQSDCTEYVKQAFKFDVCPFICAHTIASALKMQGCSIRLFKLSAVNK